MQICSNRVYNDESLLTLVSLHTACRIIHQCAFLDQCLSIMIDRKLFDCHAHYQFNNTMQYSYSMLMLTLKHQRIDTFLSFQRMQALAECVCLLIYEYMGVWFQVINTMLVTVFDIN